MSSTQDLTHPSYLLPLLKATAITTTFFNAGTFTSSVRFLPSIYPIAQLSPQKAAQQWQFYYKTLYATVPRTDLVTILSCAALAYLEHRANPSALSWKVWASACAIMPVGWAFVVIKLYQPSDKLKAVAEGTEGKEGGEEGEKEAGAGNGDRKRREGVRVLGILKEFNQGMGARMVFPWVVGGLALFASLSGK